MTKEVLVIMQIGKGGDKRVSVMMWIGEEGFFLWAMRLGEEVMEKGPFQGQMVGSKVIKFLETM
jgi:hypothetical protein